MNTELAYKRLGRIEAIDVLRGFTLCGIIIVHMVEQYYAGVWPQQYGDATIQTLADKITAGFIGLFITGKFYMIFSFLFGLSFFIQFAKSDSEKNFTGRFAWRLTILFIIGFLHHLHYRGDILTIYALLGFGLLLCYRLPANYLLVTAIFLILNVPAMIARSVDAIFPTGDGNPFDFPQSELLAYYTTLKSGSYLQILQANLFEFATKMKLQLLTGRIYITFGLFLLGIYAGRKNIFGKLEENIPLFKKLLRYSLLTIPAAIVLAAIIFGGVTLAGLSMSPQVNWLIGGFFMDVFNTALGIIYVAGIIMLYQKEKWQKLLYFLYPVGRMGLTTYLMQSFFGTLIFFNYGFGLLTEIGALVSLLFAIGLFIIQVYFAKVWFRYFAFGPFEWLWRNLTYLKLQPISLMERDVQEAKIN